MSMRPGGAIARDIGAPVGLDGRMAAFGITEMVDETMANAARVHAVEQGKVVAEHALIAFGGAGAAARRAPRRQARSRHSMIVPTEAGVGSAVGFLRAPVAYEVGAQPQHAPARLRPRPAANAIIEEMHAEAIAVVRSGAPDARIEETRGAYMRYVGQGHEIFVTFPARALGPGDLEVVQRAFDREYSRLYRRTIPEAEVEVLTWALTISTVASHPEPVADVEPRPAPAPVDFLRVPELETGGDLDVPLFWRPDLEPGAVIPGPAIVAEDETSTFVTRRFRRARRRQPLSRHRAPIGETTR